MYKCYAIYCVNAGSKKGQASSVPESQEPIHVRASKRAVAGKFIVCSHACIQGCIQRGGGGGGVHWDLPPPPPEFYNNMHVIYTAQII